ncbi:ABC transporter ATP-binding protein [Pelagibacterium halotolerans]|uniref:Oligopeptide transport ATP-binding protein OppD n=1 Tax=Pelagibacterium halotolerans (strain DSM 22347 / JCM 15775 / CGMCC 1.7692 / B2) TaxID=1082931 RepID=G4REH2_PELHB|nr:ABC transporter ATP-binding protein [Pelagibacterium halotolerans]AEQ53904.1 oligopeptide transport ATP-binding protein OppD [Pelagibacterium halotolerans B2]QJR19953.1 ABC transporter ATP-binding protein [Pelagibacterium halotolerans]SEA46218.1 peptide/nickel transport system ATP-binding protein/peptide/nickel transport system ATP-binding protein [Pelagibacterium halotolerans]
MSQPVLSVKDLSVVFHLRRGDFTAVNSISFDIMPGEVLGVVGESGAGKSMTGTAIMGLIDPPGEISATSITLSGDRIDGLDEESLRKIRGRRIGMVMQDPLTSLNPLFTVGEQLIETIRRHLPLNQDEARTRAIALLADAGIPDPQSRIDSYPHQFSGGMRQRVVISLALAAEPELVIADEPTSALDVSVQAQIIKVLKRLCAERGVAVMLITHDMGVIAEAADRMIVMNKGEIVETGPVGDIIHRPKEPYTIKLIEAIPSIKAQNPRYAAAVARGDVVQMQAKEPPLVVVDELTKQFDLSGSFLARVTGRNRKIVKAVNGVSFAIERGKTYGLVGESGSGKSTCARMMVGLLPPTAGTVTLEGTDIWSKGAAAKRRSKIQMIFQDPYASLNPRWRVGDIIAEPMRALGIARKPGEIAERVADLLERVRLDPVSMRKYPHEFSGGQRQRIAIARALSSQPEFIICDEPTSALDVSVQAQVLELMSRLQEEFGLTYLLISHNLAVVRQMADAVGVLHNGNLVESGPVEDIFSAPRADYTRMLLNAVPDISKVA